MIISVPLIDFMADEDKQNSENGKSIVVAEDYERGVAAIKPQYLTNKDKFHGYLDADGKEVTEEQCDQAGENDDSNSVTAEPVTKKIKLDDSAKEPEEQNDKTEKKRSRGQNKSRPHVKYNLYEQQRLCPSIVQECASKCFFGEKCKFLHDVEKYLSEKQEDIGPKCHLYETFGKCIYGLSCRFAKSHLGEDFKNLINQELVKQWEGKAPVRNSLDKGLQSQLRKKKVPFDKTDKFLKLLNKSQKPTKGKDDAKPPPAAHSVTTEGSGDQPIDPLSTDCTKQVTGDGETKTVTVTSGPLTDEDIIKLRPCEKKKIDFRNKLYLAPLTTCGNLPYRRICKRLGADITCGEMAMCTNLLQGHSSEWALVKRHHSEDLFGVQIEGSFPDTMTKCAELLNSTIDVDFVDINVGCPIDLVYKKGGGCGLMTRTNKFEQIVKGMNSVLDVPLTVKIRTGVQEKVNLAHKLIPDLREWGASLVTLHGRSREQRYTKLADWEYISRCAKIADPLPLFGNGDIFSFEDANRAMQTGVSGIMLARGALVKPWLFTEIKEQRHWDISSSERFGILREFTNHGMEHWGSDTSGLEKTRRFMLEWLSFLCRYIPVGLLERLPQKINERPPYYMGRDYMETLMASQNVGDWIKISEMLLGPVPPNFTFLPKHKANSYK
ncbi:tRNA-dihydrouridine(47) synthase [NAD(P)(+)]-like isoform X1 [Rana temporaria]|uniref:tRNA-dihydrouridine(47) synthase [NAD(P)(+)]-like isoform X1 n=1 Tax=Rana temporaria TaxID=8407 RepID=UPI001AAC7BBB|nr:tRNA-dihydrouridine(47) synthase [NAD(P)(+)]-like isoform X1 [Rana temporaria]